MGLISLALDTFLTGQRPANVLLSTSSSRNPGSHFPRRPVSYVLCMPTREVSNPITRIVLMKADDL